MFIAEPSDAIQDVMEINFGFQITSIAGMTTDEFKKKNNMSGENGGTDGEAAQTEVDAPAQIEQKKEEEKKDGSECAAMKQEELMKQALMQGAKKIYSRQSDVSPLLSQQIVSFMGKFEGILKVTGLKLLIRVKLYELLHILIQIDNDIINKGISERAIPDLVVVSFLILIEMQEDYEAHDSNSNMLNVLNQIIIAICHQQVCFELKSKLFKDSQLLFRLAKRLCLSEYSV